MPDDVIETAPWLSALAPALGLPLLTELCLAAVRSSDLDVPIERISSGTLPGNASDEHCPCVTDLAGCESGLGGTQ
jgi:hypothetical protein